MTNQTCVWKEHVFTIYEPTNACQQKDGGVYIFAGLNAQGLWRAFYIGETKSFAERLPGHEKWLDAVRMGTTHIHLKVVYTEIMRESVEKELIDYYKPPLNN